MSPDLQNQLYSNYPSIFRNKDKSMQESCMHWGIETGDGWYDLIDHMCAAFEGLYTTGFNIDNEYIPVDAPKVVMDQIKTKYATLRAYHHLEWPDSFCEQAKMYPDAQKIMDRYSDYIDGIVHMAETMSGRTCEYTGKPGELHVSGGGWYATLNREYAKSDSKMVERNYVPVADLPKEEEITS